MHQQHFEQGNVYLEQNEWPKAIVEYSKAIELNPEFADAYANRAVAYFEWREYAGEGDCQYGQVIADYEKAVELNPFIELDIRLALAYVHRGECFFKNRKYDEAAADYAKALELDPLIKSRTPSTVYIDLIERDLHDQQYDRAIMYITKALAFKPKDTEYYYHKLAEAYHGRGIENFYCPEPDDAIADLSKAIELDPTNAEHYSGRAFIYSTLADYYWDKADYYWYQDEYQLFEEAVINLVDNNNKAIADFTKVIELAPERAEVYFKRGQCYAGNEDYIRAITDFTKAIELGREDWSVYFNRACAYKELGDKNKALADYRKTLALTEDDFIREQSLKYIEELESEGELKVHFSDVGQGDSILIDFGDIEVLIDGGGKSPGVVSYIDDYIDGVLEVIVATHPHADHIGGLIDVLAAFEVQGIWLNGDTSTSETYSQFMSAVNSEGAQVHEARRGDTIEVSDLAFNVLHPASLDDTINNNSIVLRLNYGEIDFLFMGDAEKEAEVSMLAAGVVPDIEILKVGHHGSRTSSSAQFLNAVNPEIAIYMAGEGNSYGHPHQETITALDEFGAEIYGTDIYGTIIVTTDGESYSVQLAPPVVEPTPAKFTVTNLSISPSEVTAGETVTISFDVTNSGGSPGSYTAILKINGSAVETKSVVLNAGESQEVSFTVAKESIGTYAIEVGGSVGTFSVTKQVVQGTLAVSSSVKFPALGGGTQTLYATVTLDGQPVQGADVSITVYYKTVTRAFTASPTGADGGTQISWSVGRPRGGYTVRIKVVATYQGQSASTTTGFYAP